MDKISLHRINKKFVVFLIMFRFLVGFGLLYLTFIVFSDSDSITKNSDLTFLYSLLPLGGVALIYLNLFREIVVAIDYNYDLKKLLISKFHITKGFYSESGRLTELKIDGKREYQGERYLPINKLKISNSYKNLLRISNHSVGFDKDEIKLIYQRLMDIKEK